MLFCTFSLIDKKCIKGDIEYSIATYSDEVFLKPDYQKYFDSLFQKPVYHFFCNQEIKNLPIGNKKDNKSPSQSHLIEPLFIDIATFNGVYAKRIYSLDSKVRKPTRFRCGFSHYLFIISNNEYIELTSNSLKNEELIKKSFKTSFTEEEILRMIAFYKNRIICNDYTFLPPTYIKKAKSVIFDASKE